MSEELAPPRAEARESSERLPLAERYAKVRRRSELLTAPLTPEDQVVQVDWFASPTKWHLAHTTWFFETFVLSEADPEYRPFHPSYRDFFNSYYHAVGDQIPQGARGYYSRPTVEDVSAYRRHVDERMREFLSGDLGRWEALVVLGLNHEEQHQELILTDIKYALGHNPLRPVYKEADAQTQRPAPDPGEADWHAFNEGIREIGHHGEGFAFDNETPRHRVFLEAFEIASRPVTCGEFLQFINGGGYDRPDLWLAAGWKALQQHGWRAPLYWRESADGWETFTLAGARKVDPAEPVCHLSYFEADAYARWAGARLPTEAEWEVAAEGAEPDGNFMESERFHPAPSHRPDAGESLAAMFGDVWEWTASAYLPYPRYHPPEGAIGEYNGKFMCGQHVLRGGSCATSRDHIRPTYRNFFPPELRWQFMGLRLARDPR